MKRTPKDSRQAEPMPDGAELLRMLREDVKGRGVFLEELEMALNESLKNDPPPSLPIETSKPRKRTGRR